MIEFIVFDLDGTLVDSHRDIANAANALVEELGGERLPDAAIVAMVGEGAALLVRRALAAAGIVF
jgi:phosphoglycolate phosphatase